MVTLSMTDRGTVEMLDEYATTGEAIAGWLESGWEDDQEALLPTLGIISEGGTPIVVLSYQKDVEYPIIVATDLRTGVQRRWYRVDAHPVYRAQEII